MSLKKNGWGTMEMILLSLGLLIALLIAAFFVSKLYGSLDNATRDRIYTDLEYKLEEAAKRYVNENNIEINNEYRINLATLQDANLIGNFKDDNNNECNGYVIVSRMNSIYYYDGFITCPNYETLSY